MHNGYALFGYNDNKYELNDEELDQVVGGYRVGDTVTCLEECNRVLLGLLKAPKKLSGDHLGCARCADSKVES